MKIIIIFRKLHRHIEVHNYLKNIINNIEWHFDGIILPLKEVTFLYSVVLPSRSMTNSQLRKMGHKYCEKGSVFKLYNSFALKVCFIY